MTVLRIVSGSANPGLASAIVNYLGGRVRRLALKAIP